MNDLNNSLMVTDETRYARCVEASKRIRWDIDEDVIRNRTFDQNQKYLPDGLSGIDGINFLDDDEKRYLSQIQGRTYANMFGLVERFINAKVLEISCDHSLGDQIKLEALVRFSEEELKHQELFRRIEKMIGDQMASGYEFVPRPDPVAELVLGKSTWAVLGLTLLIEIFTQAHYKESIAEEDGLSPLFKDIFRFHWMEESQHATLDELEWRRENEKLSEDELDRAVTDLIELVAAVDGILQAQATSDAEYFGMTNGRALGNRELEKLSDEILNSYRRQFIFSGAEHPKFGKVLGELITPEQGDRIAEALAALS